MGATAPFWRFSAASYPDIVGAMLVESFAAAAVGSLAGDSDLPLGGMFILWNPVGVPGRLKCLMLIGVSLMMKIPVAFNLTLSMLVNDAPGVLNGVTGVFSRRGYNIQSLAVGPAEKEGISYITNVVPGTGVFSRRGYNIQVQDLTHLPFAERELMLIKIAANTSACRNVLDIASIF
ncbi:acetolactate synthase small subunit 1, chloroplastic-like isoform X2 [Aristolochia californica]|uniref:acetolactate synthase small subunit 1, chloroplastic-like isoform X2 n=1 Tax=Aristolochia californica TaxID=171875 RepID=UPI0035DDC439